MVDTEQETSTTSGIHKTAKELLTKEAGFSAPVTGKAQGPVCEECVRMLVEECFGTEPMWGPGLGHESMPQGNTKKQNYCMAEAIDLSQLPHPSRWLEIVWREYPRFAKDRARLIAELPAYVRELRDFCGHQEQLRTFALFRYYSVELTLDYLKESALLPTDTSKPWKRDSESGNSPAFNTRLMQLLRSVIIAVREICEKIYTKLTKLSSISLLDAFSEENDKFFLCSLDLQRQLGFITDELNNIAKDYLPHYTDDLEVFPRFPTKPELSIWRVCATVFNLAVYGRLSAHINHALLVELSARRHEELIWKHTQLQAGEERKSSAPPNTPPQRFGKLRDLRRVERHVQAIVDNNINELTVHYVNSTQLAPHKLLRGLDKEIQYDLQVFYTQVRGKYPSLPFHKFIELIRHDVAVCKVALPPAVARLVQQVTENEIELCLTREREKRRQELATKNATTTTAVPDGDLAQYIAEQYADLDAALKLNKRKGKKYEGNIPRMKDIETQMRSERLGIFDVTKVITDECEQPYCLNAKHILLVECALDQLLR
jgi:hypothetical protein